MEYTWDAGHYVLQPGDIRDLPDEEALAAIRQSVVRFQDGDETGMIDYFRIEDLSNVDPAKVREIATYECPFKATGLCNHPTLQSMSEFVAHLKTHRDLMQEPIQKQAPAPVK